MLYVTCYMKYLIANWKAHKSNSEALSWIKVFSVLNPHKLEKKVTFIICPPYPLLSLIKTSLSQFSNVKIGAQDVSSFDEGTYTGEVTAHTLSGLISHVIIGHSERKKYFHETDETCMLKCQQAYKNGIHIIYCTEKTVPPSMVEFVVFEPTNAISKGSGVGANITAQEVLAAKQTLAVQIDQKYIYGGSVNEKDIGTYLSYNEIDGFLSGGASLDPHRFYRMGEIISKK